MHMDIDKTGRYIFAPCVNFNSAGKINILFAYFNDFSISPAIYQSGENLLVTNRAGKLFAPGVTGTFNLKTGVFKITVGSGSSKVTGYGAGQGAGGGGYYLTKTNAQAVIIVPPA